MQIRVVTSIVPTQAGLASRWYQLAPVPFEAESDQHTVEPSAVYPICL